MFLLILFHGRAGKSSTKQGESPVDNSMVSGDTGGVSDYGTNRVPGGQGA